MSAPSSTSEKSSSIWSVLNLIIGSVLGGAVLLWVLAFIFDGLGSLRPKAKAEAAAAPAAEAAPVEIAVAEVAAAPAAADPKHGEKVFLGNCAACHQATGAGLPPTFPALTGSKVVAGPIDAQITQVLKGKNAMPPFAQLSDADIAAVVTYTRNNLGNKVGDAATPEQVKKLR